MNDNLNKDNFLQWKGTFNDFPFQVLAVDDGPVAYPAIPALDYVDVDIMGNDVCTYPLAELNILYYSWIGKAPKWMGTGLRIYAPNTFSGTGTVTYQFKDILGRLSNIATVYINFTNRSAYWKGYEPTQYCEVTGSGQNTGQLKYADRQQYYVDNDQPVLPYIIQPNYVDADYVAAITDTTTCPVPSQLFIPINVVNGYGYVEITEIKMTKGGHPDVVFPTSLITPGTSGATFPLPYYAGTGFDDLIISYDQKISDISSKGITVTLLPSTVITGSFPAGSIGAHSVSLGPLVPGILGLSFITGA